MTSAIISDCGKYRYRLDRNVLASDAGTTFLYVGVNPSTADASVDDATVRKWIGFTKRNGGGRFIVGNLFAYRATDVRELGKVADPIGPENNLHLRDMIAEADVIVPCWGSRTKIPDAYRHRGKTVEVMLFTSSKPVKVFGDLTKTGDPRHPLMIGYDTPLKDWGPDT